ncbi:phage gp6-like head-tail connector protein [Romboutsia weinsteinii]|uniref:Phage gp6-like head-tail connector protein n=1 Tax=Romboutsia weinsteinii TaxID=2020949 RepID=A0A371JAS4_9FIRM|nr:head-tail connector protein [Romboutsia weinsteinii]RDY29757.1 phage gp6-like head-tail connector protein [Romboutsia weinsteinii]
MYSIKDIDLDFMKNYLRIELEFTDDDIEIEMFMMVAKEYLMQVCGLTEQEYLQAKTLVPALLILVSEMYEYRSAMVQTNTKANPLIQRYINSSRKFL